MQHFRKYLYFLILILSSSIFSQSPLRVGASFNVIFPSGDYTEIAKSGVGGTLEADYSFIPKYSILFSSSYSNLTSKIPQIGIDGKAIDFSINSFDFLVGARYNINNSFFVFAKTGISYLKLYANIYNGSSNSSDGTSTNYEPYYTFAPGVGYRYNLAKDKSDFEFSTVYKFTKGDVSNFNTFILKASLMVYL